MNTFSIDDSTTNLSKLVEKVRSDDCGAISTFSGQTRSYSLIKTDKIYVKALFYEAYVDMALKDLLNISNKTRLKYPSIKHIAIHHKIGYCPVGTDSVLIAVSSPHRQDAINACHDLIDLLKTTTPIWKKEIYLDGSETWKENCEHHRIK